MQSLSAEKKPGLIFRLKQTFPFCPLFFALIFTLFLFNSIALAVTEDWILSTRRSILALDSARTTAVKELGNSSLSEQEVADYQDFIIYLTTRVVTYCRELSRLGGTTALVGLPCSTDAMQGDGHESISPQTGNTPTTPQGVGTSQTGAEKTQEMDDRFLATLGNFDEMLLEEEVKLASRVPKQRESGDAGQGGSGMSSSAAGRPGESGSGEASSAGQQGMGSEKDSGTDGTTGEQSATRGTGGVTGTPGRGGGEVKEGRSVAGTPDGRLPPPKDDDIVARQLREAAEKETDPELKKKLWEEYWKYKGVTRKGE